MESVINIEMKMQRKDSSNPCIFCLLSYGTWQALDELATTVLTIERYNYFP